MNITYNYLDLISSVSRSNF